MINKKQNKQMLDTIEGNEDYPDFIAGKKIGKGEYKSCIEFTGGKTYEEDRKKAIKYAKDVKGIVYTIIDGEGRWVDYAKGFHIFNRLGYAVIIKC